MSIILEFDSPKSTYFFVHFVQIYFKIIVKLFKLAVIIERKLPILGSSNMLTGKYFTSEKLQ